MKDTILSYHVEMNNQNRRVKITLALNSSSLNQKNPSRPAKGNGGEGQYENAFTKLRKDGRSERRTGAEMRVKR